MKQANGIRAAADAGNQDIRQAAGLLQNLRARFAADDRLKFTHHQRVWMRPQRAAEQIVSVGNIRHPIAQRFVNGILQRARAGIDLAHFSAEQLHAKDIQSLPAHVFRAHVDHALETKQRAHGRRCYAVLARARFGDDASLAHAPREQHLAQSVIDLVRAGVQQVFALEIDARAAGILSQALGKEQRRGPTGKISQQRIEFRVKRFIVARDQESFGQLFERRHQSLRHKATAVTAPVAERSGCLSFVSI